MESLNSILEFFRFNPNNYEMLLRLFSALLAGTIIGCERTYRGRPAGFRTHALVCVSSSLLMMVTVYQTQWMGATSELVIRMDPTRMGQGIMTGIGFLGAGVIMKEGPTVRGLTTAASIWITAGIGILAGIGFFFPMAVSVLMTIGILSTLRWVENLLPSEAYYEFDVRGEKGPSFTEEMVRDLVKSCGFRIARTSYLQDERDNDRRYTMVLRSYKRGGSARLAHELEAMEQVMSFKIIPITE